MIETSEKVYGKFSEIPLRKYWNSKKNFGVILYMANPNEILDSNLGRAQIGDMMKLQIGLYFIGKAQGVNGYIGGGSILSLRSYALAWKQWVKMWPIQSNQHRLEFYAIVDDVCLHFDINTVQPRD
jgi:hypothetical protein